MSTDNKRLTLDRNRPHKRTQKLHLKNSQFRKNTRNRTQTKKYEDWRSSVAASRAAVSGRIQAMKSKKCILRSRAPPPFVFAGFWRYSRGGSIQND
ncbi:hypothetical protein Y032_0042g701 [Ancylostoma ceylanicum]|uniref:Uncharacterized protein n=1 Tax=Ancylostoma ceylanicum TaxID=53326 RepID=A0A016UG14_9BILA|nr:hypothetical protein Y032_0042g701 [Ancylostoma ceylanicum]